MAPPDLPERCTVSKTVRWLSFQKQLEYLQHESCKKRGNVLTHWLIRDSFTVKQILTADVIIVQHNTQWSLRLIRIAAECPKLAALLLQRKQEHRSNWLPSMLLHLLLSSMQNEVRCCVGSTVSRSDLETKRIYLWWSWCTLYLHACQARGTVGASGLCVRATSMER